MLKKLLISSTILMLFAACEVPKKEDSGSSSSLSSLVAFVSAGNGSACAFSITGELKCWGNNLSGQLGDGTNTDRLMPTSVKGIGKGVTSVGVSDFGHACALVDGGVKCWGDNAKGAVGNGTFVSSNSPVSVSGLESGVKSIFSSGSQSCAVLNDGSAKCWGYNNYGQLGDGTKIDRSSPVSVASFASGVTSISDKIGFACAVANGGLKCWGNNILAPTGVASFGSGVKTVSLGYYFRCTLTESGAVKCAGENGMGQLGRGHTNVSATTEDVSGLTSGVEAISVGSYHACALSSGSVYCWGANEVGEIGDGSASVRSSPILVNLPVKAVAISAGNKLSCAVLIDGRLMCWGDNRLGQVGDGTTVDRYTPTFVSF